jgi:DNA modification methylase
VPPLPAAAITQRGDLWRLGDHRVLCADSTDPAELQVVLEGQLADCVWTDPPYNVAYEGTAGSIQNDAMSDADFAVFLEQAFAAIAASMHEGAPIYVAHSDTGGFAFRKAFVEAGFKLSSCLIWRKNALVLSRGDYHWRHEPILYGWKAGAAHRWYGGRDKTTIAECRELAFQQVGEDEWQIVLGETTLLVRGRELTVQPVRGTVFDEAKPVANVDHPTMKPVGLIARMLANSARRGDRVLDPFGGSGSTLIACESLGLKAHLVELDERYVDVMVARWEALTGKKATREPASQPSQRHNPRPERSEPRSATVTASGRVTTRRKPAATAFAACDGVTVRKDG